MKLTYFYIVYNLFQYIYIYIYIFIIRIYINETSYSFDLLGLRILSIPEPVSESDPKIQAEVAKYPNDYWIRRGWISESKRVISEPERVISKPEWISEDNQT